MFRRRLNELRVSLRIIPDSPSPLLIKSGVEPAAGEPARWVRMTKDGVCQPYVPGSSLRGVLRTAATHIVSRWQPGWALASDPFDNLAQHVIQSRLDSDIAVSSAEIYDIAGPIDRCFGFPGLRGRWLVDDAVLERPPATNLPTRHGVAIDRKTGAARAHLKFEFEYVADGTFLTTLTIVNYELWQLGLLAHVLARLDGGEARVGYGKHRGLGKVRVAVASMEFRWYGVKPTQDAHGLVTIPSLASLAESAGLHERYGWRDAGLMLALPLDTDATFPFGSGWKITPPKLAPIADLGGFQPLDWAASPWPESAALLPGVMTGWLPPEHPKRTRQEEMPVREGSGS